MSRPERPLDPADGPLAAFASQLRELRSSAGSPTYLSMQRRTGRSRTALSEAAGGDHLPSWETVEAYVVACDGDIRWWLDYWHETQDQVRGDRSASLQASAGKTSNESVSSWPADDRRWLTRRRSTVLGIAVVVIAAGTWSGLSLTRRFAGDPHCEDGPCVFTPRESAVVVWSDSTTDSVRLGSIPNDASVRMLCWIDHQMLRPPRANYASDRWFKVESGALVGFVHSASVYSQTQVPHC